MKLVKGLAIFSAVVMIAGCSSQGAANVNNQVSHSNVVETDSGSSSVSNSDSSSVTVDNYGRRVEITQIPQKVLTLGPNATELFIALGLSSSIIGNSLDNHSRGALPEYVEAYDKIPELTYGPATREAVLTSGADFVYGIDWEFGEEGLNIDELDQYGIKAYVNSATTLEQMFKEIRDIGSIFQIAETAEKFIEDQQKRIQDVQDIVKAEDATKVLVYDSGGNGVFTATGSNFESLLIQYAGGENIFNDIKDKQWTTVSYEEILARQPEVIVIHDYDVPSLEQKIQEIKADPVLSQLDAVKNERFVSISLESVLPGDRMAYSIERLAKGFHPKLF